MIIPYILGSGDVLKNKVKNVPQKTNPLVNPTDAFKPSSNNEEVMAMADNTLRGESFS